jgi:hypothetical protein
LEGVNGVDEDVYQPQYHPKAELGNIFGGGNKTFKINHADEVQSPPQSPDVVGDDTEEIDDGDQHHTH